MGPSWSKTVLNLQQAKHQAPGLLPGACGWEPLTPSALLQRSTLTQPRLLLRVSTAPLLPLNLQHLHQQAETLSCFPPFALNLSQTERQVKERGKCWCFRMDPWYLGHHWCLHSPVPAASRCVRTFQKYCRDNRARCPG